VADEKKKKAPKAPGSASDTDTGTAEAAASEPRPVRRAPRKPQGNVYRREPNGALIPE
jgi:hypothetical protein